MKNDECDLIIGKNPDIYPKRLKYIYQKWVKKGWWDEGLTVRGKEIVEAMKKLEDAYWIPDEFEGRVVNVQFRRWWYRSTGIFLYHGDNGWHYYTVPSVRRRCGAYWVKKEDIAYIELHPDPCKIWRKINYWYWRQSNKQEEYRVKDAFHQKAGWLYRIDGFKEGECLPNCQCKLLPNLV